LLVAYSTYAAAQKSEAEIRFEKNKARYTREHFAEGEDASSGFDYLFYKSGPKIVKIRSIWSATHSQELRVTDFYFDRDDVVFIRRSTTRKANYRALTAGREMALKSTEEMHFANGKLLRWIENGKVIPPDDKRWAEHEKGNVENAKAERENYDSLKNNN
jgi:hypothetical protein